MNCINYGGLLFTNPVPVAYALPPKDPGLYVIQVRNLSFGPVPFQPIAFGASDNLAAIRLELHPHFPRWKIHRLANLGLFASYFPLRYEAAAYREETQAELIAQYLDHGTEAIKRAQQAVALSHSGDEFEQRKH